MRTIDADNLPDEERGFSTSTRVELSLPFPLGALVQNIRHLSLCPWQSFFEMIGKDDGRVETPVKSYELDQYTQTKENMSPNRSYDRSKAQQISFLLDLEIFKL